MPLHAASAIFISSPGREHAVDVLGADEHLRAARAVPGIAAHPGAFHPQFRHGFFLPGLLHAEIERSVKAAGRVRPAVNGSDATFLLDNPGDIHGLIGADNFVDTIASTSPFLEGHLPALLIGADTLFIPGRDHSARAACLLIAGRALAGPAGPRQSTECPPRIHA